MDVGVTLNLTRRGRKSSSEVELSIHCITPVAISVVQFETVHRHRRKVWIVEERENW
jgi:hypothetical protein